MLNILTLIRQKYENRTNKKETVDNFCKRMSKLLAKPASSLNPYYQIATIESKSWDILVEIYQKFYKYVHDLLSAQILGIILFLKIKLVKPRFLIFQSTVGTPCQA